MEKPEKKVRQELTLCFLGVLPFLPAVVRRQIFWCDCRLLRAFSPWQPPTLEMMRLGVMVALVPAAAGNACGRRWRGGRDLGFLSPHFCGAWKSCWIFFLS